MDPIRVCSFAPVVGARTRILILGSMPGVASLAAGQYYAHPRNQFWGIMGALCGAGPERSYRERLRILTRARLGLWDVLESCVRPGSLDAAIEHASATPNDLPALLRQRAITRVCCNGGTAHRALQRYFAARLAREFADLEVCALPSTSPANASWSYARKLRAWRTALEL
ncbi:MAG TPA: DNA-deoxyinosine glycosylase [Steroidobacteraceae bacterium]